MKPYFLLIIVAIFFFACHDHEKTDTTSVHEKKTARKSLPDDIIFLTARPDSISFDASSTAVIVVDMQNDFGAKGGMFDKAGIDISIIQQVIEPISNVLSSARKRGIQIIYLKMGFKQDLSDVGGLEYPTRMKRLKRMHIGDTVNAPNGAVSRILIHDTWNTDIIPNLQPQPGDIIIKKNRFNGFYKTTLDSVLQSLEKKYLIITGCTTSVCVESTVRDAAFRNYLPIVLEDCTAEPIGHGLPRSNHEASLLIIKTSFGLVSTSKEFLKSIGKHSTVEQ